MTAPVLPSLAALARALHDGLIDAADLAETALARAAAAQADLNALIALAPERARADAGRARQQRASGTAGPLAGIPFAHKDLFCTRGLATTCGSRMLDGFVPPYDAAVVERLDHAGAV
ncbi:MAG: hypothetical protein JNJ74_03950, partial [Xanthomonadales bacterium]|nr:hypothetical protein [Xanthomonadales bacterium]